MPKNTLVQYQGGGYSGCFWEWNFFLFDDKGNFHDIHSSGSGGIDNAEAALAKIQEDDTNMYLYDLAKEKDIETFQKETNEGLVVGVVNAVNNVYFEAQLDSPMWWVCDFCKEKVNDGFADGYEGCGGIASQATIKICPDCQCLHSCSYCGEMYEDTSEFDEEGYCEWCAKEYNNKEKEAESLVLPQS